MACYALPYAVRSSLDVGAGGPGAWTNMTGHRPPRERTQNITATNPSEATAWAKHLGCSVAELRIALRAVGNSVHSVRTYLAALNGQELTLVTASRPTDVRSVAENVPLPTQLPVWPATRPSDL